MPASRSEAPPPHAVERGAEQKNFLFLLEEKIGGARKIKKVKKIFLRGSSAFGGMAAGRSEWIFSEIFDKIGSSGIV